jgi:hypothetical protein
MDKKFKIKKIYSSIKGLGGNGGVVAPVFVSAEIGTVNGSTVAVTFDQECLTPPAVTIKENGVATTHDGGTIQGDAHIVYYVIPIPWHGSDDVITVDNNAVTNNIAWAAELDLQADIGVTSSVTPFAGTGTLTQVDNDVTGDGALFLSEVVIGDVINAASIDGIVTAITSDTALTLDTPATVAVGEAYNIEPQAGTARVSTWSDQSINGNDFTASGTARPSLQTIGGYPFIVSDGGNDWMDGGVFADNLSTFTVISIIRRSGGNGTSLNKIDVDVDWEYNGWSIFSDGSIGIFQQPDGGLYKQANQGQLIPPGAGEIHMITMEKISNTEMHCYLDGVLNDAFNPTNIHPNGAPVSFTNSVSVKLWVEGGVNGVSDFGYLDEAAATEMLLYPSPPTADRAALEQRLADRYGVTL